ncbi:MAG TPA: type II toxin-antitoxin system prevent-host-death family antitoxin [Polaromonas sp.]|uniref:type II toxin-antitoxin system prevent-host-death family antitoxin n=1 Tax=Polaromonas sp. TaxID=1869339 RepID=UPI002D6D78BD|nr:type II toxin-antitoxin system prevent-host-death family antitoxin [Polaromonas sp.]HYW57309.1 type II toxin-antitoxin system prevent-host-death family antitoxin [Polaromonas sp.]
MQASPTRKITDIQLPQWQLQEAKNRFSAVVKAAAIGPAQVVTVHGVPAAVVLSPETYERLVAVAAPAQSLSEALRCPELDAADEALFERNRTINLARELRL